MAKYYDCWEKFEDIDYPEARELGEDQIIYAGYTYESYSGDALIVFMRDGKLFENNDGHCSCYGLETWEPEETSVEALRERKGWPGLVEELDKLCRAE